MTPPTTPSGGPRGRTPEPPTPGAARLRCRRRLLLGAVPALVLAVVSVWLVAVLGLTLAASSAYDAGDYETAVSRFRRVAAINPWLEQWRVHYNTGTALYSAGDVGGARESLEAALEQVPQEEPVDPTTGYKPAGSPECRVRHNLSLAYTALADQARAAGDGRLAEEHRGAATQAAGDCEVPEPPEPDEDPTQDPSQDSTAEPSDQPSDSQPSEDSSDQPSEDSSSQDDEEPQPEPAPSGGATSQRPDEPSQEAAERSSPTPGDERAQRLRDRNEGSTDQASPQPKRKKRDGEAEDPGGYRPW